MNENRQVVMERDCKTYLTQKMTNRVV